MTTTRFRYGVAARAAAVIFVLGSIALAGQSLALAPVILVPLAALVYVLRAGVDADAEAVTVRVLTGTRRVPWSQVTGLDSRGARVALLVEGGRAVLLPVLRPGDAPRLLAAGGQSLDATGRPADQ